MSGSFSIDETNVSDLAQIEQLLDQGFGIERRIKTSYRLREGNRVVQGLSLVIREAALGVVGTICFWPVCIGEKGTGPIYLGAIIG